MNEEYKRSMNTITMNADWMANYEQELREQIAKEIKDTCDFPDPLGYCSDYDNQGELNRICNHWEDAAIARGQK